MRDYSDFNDEEIIKKYKEAKKLRELSSFNNSQERKSQEIEVCFLEAELIRRKVVY